MGNRLDHRVTNLEQAAAPKRSGLSVVIIEEGETYEQAAARFPNDENASLRIIIDMTKGGVSAP